MSNDDYMCCYVCGSEDHDDWECGYKCKECYGNHEDHTCSTCETDICYFSTRVNRCENCAAFLCLLRECRKRCKLCSDLVCLRCSRRVMVDGICQPCLSRLIYNGMQRELTMQEHCLKAILDNDPENQNHVDRMPEATRNRLEQLRVKRRRML